MVLHAMDLEPHTPEAQIQIGLAPMMMFPSTPPPSPSEFDLGGDDADDEADGFDIWDLTEVWMPTEEFWLMNPNPYTHVVSEMDCSLKVER